MAGLSYNPALDGLRAVAVLAVLCFHAAALQGGYLGVDVFLVLSGFLISSLMLAERATVQRVSVRAFYVRRAYRLLPAYLVFVAVGSALYLGLRSGIKQREFFESALSSLLYLNNVYRMYRPDMGGVWFGHVWSLSVEAQFYLLWPLLVTVLCRRPSWREHFTQLLLLGAALVCVWRWVLLARGADHFRIYMGIDTRADALLIGCALGAFRQRGYPWLRAAASQAQRSAASGHVASALGALSLGLLALLACTAPGLEGDLTWLDYGGYTLVALLSAVLVWSLDVPAASRWQRLFALRPIAGLGKISYGIYLWHYPVVALLGPLSVRVGKPLVLVAATLISTALAWLSHQFVERPFLRLRPAWADHEAAARSQTSPAEAAM